MIRGMSTAKYAIESNSCEGSVPGAVGFVLDPWGLVRGQSKESDDPQSSRGEFQQIRVVKETQQLAFN